MPPYLSLTVVFQVAFSVETVMHPLPLYKSVATCPFFDRLDVADAVPSNNIVVKKVNKVLFEKCTHI